jgi:GNAT superfamily N-acetyltransferase
MRGLRLFIRPVDTSDAGIVTEFLILQNHPAPLPAWGLLGKLLGDVVAVVSLEMTEDALQVQDIVVARDLRRKWIGRGMMREVEQLALKLDRPRIVVEDTRGAEEFFRRVGFESEGDRWIRFVRS